MGEAILSTLILLLALALFISDKVRPDAAALIALLAAWLTGLLTIEEALDGFSSTAVLVIAAILVVGRAMEYTGAAAALTRVMVPDSRHFSVRLAGVLVMGVLLSAFMNNIAALVITMPAALSVARDHRLPPGAVLMPLAFATILGGMTTLIGTPANLILSSIREDAIGSPFGMFDMTEVGGAAALAGFVYLVLIGWRLTPRRRPDGEDEARLDILVFELGLPIEASRGTMTVASVRASLRTAGARAVAVLREGRRARLPPDARLFPDDRLLVMAREEPALIARKAGLFVDRRDEEDKEPQEETHITSQVIVGSGSLLIGQTLADIEAQSDGAVRVIACGQRAARLKLPLDTMRIQAGDQLFLKGPVTAVAQINRRGRLIEINQQGAPPRPGRPAMLVVAIYGAAVALSSLSGLSTAICFTAAALIICLLRLLPADEAYRSIDLPVIVLIAAMIPIGRAFDEAGGTGAIAGVLNFVLAGAPVFVMIAVLCASSMLLSIFLNNVATALVMGQVGVQAAAGLGISADAALLAVLIGSSCDFLTPIGHQNNLLVMRPGGYRFRDYPRVGAPLSILVIVSTAWVLSRAYG